MLGKMSEAKNNTSEALVMYYSLLGYVLDGC